MLTINFWFVHRFTIKPRFHVTLTDNMYTS